MVKLKVKRLRNSHACLNCQIKKVKCDTKDGKSCTNCVEAGNLCKLVKLAGRKRRRNGSANSFLPYPYFLQSPKPMVPNIINQGNLAAPDGYHKANQYTTPSTQDEYLLNNQVNHQVQYQLILPPYPQQYRPRPYFQSRVQYAGQYQYDSVNRISPQIQSQSNFPIAHGHDPPMYWQSYVLPARTSQEHYMPLHTIPLATVNVEYNPQIKNSTSDTNYDFPELND